MQKVIVLIIFLSLGLLGCRQEEELVTVTAVSPQATATIFPTVTPSPTIVVTETALPTKTNTPEPTLPSPLANISDLTMLPAISIDETISYKLQAPPYDFMRDWLFAAQETPDRVNNLLIYFTRELLAFDFVNNYPNGAGNFEHILGKLGENGSGYFPIEEIWPFLQTAVVAYLNQNQIVLEDGKSFYMPPLTLDPTPVDLGGNGVQEWLVKVEGDPYGLNILGTIPLTFESPGQYTILSNTIEPIDLSLYNEKLSDYANAKFNFDYDFTGDGHPDVIQVKQGYFLGATHGKINLYRWTDSGLHLLESIDMTVSAHQPIPTFEIGDFNDDGVTDVKVTTPHEINFDCAWDEVDIYSWVDGSPQHLLMEDLPPDTPQCAMFHAITPRGYYSDAVLAEKSRIELLEEVLSQLTLETAPSADYLALGYLHLAIAYADQQDNTATSAAFAQINTLPENSPFVKLVTDLYEEETNLVGVCQRLFTEPELAEQTEIRPYIHAGSITGFFGFGSEMFNSFAICPYPNLISKQLTSLSLPIDQHPVTSLSQFGYTFSQYESFNLDADDALEWIGIVEKNDADLILLDEVNGILKPIILSGICSECEDALEYELRQDEQRSYIIGRLSFYRNCGTMSNDLFLDNRPFLIQFTEEIFDFDTISPLCDEKDERPLAEISLTDFERVTSVQSLKWSPYSEYEDSGKSTQEYIDELQTAVLTQTDPNIHTKISELLSYLPTDDPEAQPYRKHLTYLLGYHYELSGEDDTAVSIYLDLIEQYPSSPWSWLAWARLEPN